MSAHVPGLFITGTDTSVGKTYVAAIIARFLLSEGRRVGVYKPAASGCRRVGEDLTSDDAVALWEAAGRPGELDRVCPQRFTAPLAPHLAALAEGRQLDSGLLRAGLEYWRARSDLILVEGAGGLMSPLGEDEYVADVARDFKFPLIVVSRNALGTINQTLQTLITADTKGLTVAGVIINHLGPPHLADESLSSNRRELAARCTSPLLAEVQWGASDTDASIDWLAWPANAATHIVHVPPIGRVASLATDFQSARMEYASGEFSRQKAIGKGTFLQTPKVIDWRAGPQLAKRRSRKPQ